MGHLESLLLSATARARQYGINAKAIATIEQLASSCSDGDLRNVWTMTYMAATAPIIENIHKARLSAAMVSGSGHDHII